jgi:hypothetical protein
MLPERCYSITLPNSPHVRKGPEEGFDPDPFKFSDRRLRSFEVVGGNAVATLGEGECDLPADAAGGPGDDCCAVFRQGHALFHSTGGLRASV